MSHKSFLWSDKNKVFDSDFWVKYEAIFPTTKGWKKVGLLFQIWKITYKRRAEKKEN